MNSRPDLWSCPDGRTRLGSAAPAESRGRHTGSGRQPGPAVQARTRRTTRVLPGPTSPVTPRVVFPLGVDGEVTIDSPDQGLRHHAPPMVEPTALNPTGGWTKATYH